MKESEEGARFVLAMFKYVFGENPDFYNYDKRLAIQKIAYFLKANTDILQPVNYGWYIKGPYSPKIADYAYEYMENRDMVQVDLTKEQKEILDKFIGFVSAGGQVSIDKMELYSSLLYMIKDEHIPKEQLVERFLWRKPYFSKEEIEKAVSDLCRE